MTKEANITQSTNTSLPALITVKELRAYLKISNEDAYNLVKDRSFPSFKSGNKYLVSVPDLIVWMQQEMRKPKY